MSSPKYPHICVTLVGQSGNAFNVLGSVKQALMEAGVPKSERDEFFKEATSGDYDHLLQTCIKWVTVE